MAGSPIGILLLTHATLGKHLLATAQQILPEDADGITVLGIGSGKSLAKIRGTLEETMAAMGRTHRNVLVLCDTFGATATRLLRESPPRHPRLHFVFGANLPMLLEAIGQRNSLRPDELADQVCKVGHESIFVLDPRTAEAAARGR